MLRQWMVLAAILVLPLLGCSNAATDDPDPPSTTDAQVDGAPTDDVEPETPSDGVNLDGGDFRVDGSGDTSAAALPIVPDQAAPVVELSLEDLVAQANSADLKGKWIAVTGKVDLYRVQQSRTDAPFQLVADLKPESDESGSGSVGFLSAVCFLADSTVWQKAAAGDIVTLRGYLAPAAETRLEGCTLTATSGHGASRLVLPEFLSSVAKDGVAATQKYNNATMIATGKITRLIDPADGPVPKFGSFTPNIFLADDSGNATLSVHYSPANSDAFKELAVGDEVTLIGKAVVAPAGGDKHAGGLAYAAPLSLVK